MKPGNPHLLKEGREEVPPLIPGMGRFPCTTGRMQQLDLQALPVLAADVFHLIYRHPFGGLERLCCRLVPSGRAVGRCRREALRPPFSSAARTPPPVSPGITGFSRQ